MKKLEYSNDAPDRNELFKMNMALPTLNGLPAKIHYAPPERGFPAKDSQLRSGSFAQVEQITSGVLRGAHADWCWSTVRRIIAEKGGKFVA